MSNHTPSYSHRSRGPGLFWPILLIGAGVIFLMSNLGLLPADPWPLLWRLWPVILIVIGLDILLGRRSVLGGVFSAVLALLVVGGIVALLFAAQNYPGLLNVGMPALHSERVTYPLNDVRQAQVSIHFPGGAGDILALDDSPYLIEGDLRYYGELTRDISASGNAARITLSSRYSGIEPWWNNVQEKWTIGLNTRVEYDLALDSGSGSYEFDLRRFTLRSLALEAGSGSVRLTLPESGPYRFKLDAGSGSIVIRVPEGMAARVEYKAGSGSLNAPGLSKISGGGRDGIFESAGFAEGEYSVIIELEGGSGSVTIQ